jgi:hypothetical protein
VLEILNLYELTVVENSLEAALATAHSAGRLT